VIACLTKERPCTQRDQAPTLLLVV
jgi:hypothetical protein